MVRGVIIEGLSTSGKTSLFTAIKKIHNQSPNTERTIIAISEHYSQVLHSHHGVLKTMNMNEHVQLLNRHVDYLEQQYDWIDSLGHSKISNGIFYVLERYHLNHRAAFGNNPELELLENRLIKLNAHCVLLTMSADVVESRFIESRGQQWKSYVMQNHSTVTEACQKFLEDQDRLRICAKHSRIRTLEINSDHADWDSYASQVVTQLN